MKSNRLRLMFREFLSSPILGTTLSIISIIISFVLVNEDFGFLIALLTSFLLIISFSVLLLYFNLREKPTTSFQVLYSKLAWQIHDEDGKSSSMILSQTLKCLHNNIYTFKNTSYGDSDSISFDSSVGKPIHTFFDGGKRFDIFFLQRVYNKGDVFNINIEKKMENAFTENEEWIENEIDHLMDQVELSISFPKNRNPKEMDTIWLIHKFAGSTKTILLPETCFSRSESGNLIITYRVKKPRLGSTYQIRWRW